MMSNARFRSVRVVLGALLTAAPACSGQVTGPGGNPDPSAPGPGGGGKVPGTSPGGKVPGTSPVASDSGAPCDPGQKAFGPARIWQLTDRQYVNVVRDVFGITLSGEDANIGSARTADRYSNYSEEAVIDTQAAPNYQEVALKVADLAEARLSTLVGSTTPTPAQVQAFINTKLARAWRRPVTPPESAALMNLFVSAQPDGAGRGFHLVMEAALQAPSFLYRTELGNNAATARGPIQLTPHELASALSFLFLETAPDDTLWARAQDGSLADPAVLASEVDRLMALPAARATMTLKASYWLGLAGITNRSRSARLYPEWSEAVKGSLSQSIELFLGDVVATGKLSDLFTSNRVYLSRELARLYGVPGVMGSALMPVAVPGTERSAGILTQPGFIVAANRTIDRADVVHRGLLVHDSFVCGANIPAAPPEAGDEAKKMNGTERERAAARASKSGCNPCHMRFDPLGLAFERYDALGRYSETRQAVLDSDTGMTSWQTSPTPVDASAVLFDDGRGDAVKGPINGLPDLAAKLAASPERVGYCASQKLAEYALGHNPDAENSCELKAVKQAFIRTGSFAQFFRALALSPGFRTRNPVTAPGN